MTKSELERLWVSEGGNPGAADMAAAIALAESGGNPNEADYDKNGTVDRGLWQINSVHGAQSTFEVAGNTKSAIAISDNGTNWEAWVTFKNGAYKQFLSGGGTPGPGASSSPTSTPTSSPTSSTTLTNAPEGLSGLLVKGTLYLALLLGGAAMLWLGGKTLVQPAGRKP